MPWNNELEQAYSEMFDGAMWQALDLPDMIAEPGLSELMIKFYIGKLENDEYDELRLIPENQNYLTLQEVRTLHWMRVACCFYAERQGIFPWRLRDKNVDELRPLLSFHYQGIHRCTDVRYGFEGVWDVNPGQRMKEAMYGYVLLAILALIGSIKAVPENEFDMIIYLINSMRNSGWKHVRWIGEPIWYDWSAYDGYQNRDAYGSPGTYDFEAIREVKESYCHIASNYLVALLRSFNIPAHCGYSANPDFIDKPTWNREWYGEWDEIVHKNGHCFVHFSSIGKWLSHGDDIYDALCKTIPVEYSLKSDDWMNCYHIGTTNYDWLRAFSYEVQALWCLLLGRSDIDLLDVRYLYNRGLLRGRLEDALDAYDVEYQDGAPPTVPPLFTADEVDFLMDWVAYKIEKEQENQ